ncbi:MAG: M1 family metallopeptidase, partial [Bacteroidota bacterium]
MKKPTLVLLLCFCLLQSNAQYWQQKVDYTIDVRLNEKEKSLDAVEKISYTNNSPDTLSFIWFHLWPNAYKHDQTAFSDQLLKNGNTNFYFSEKEERGYVNKLDFKVNGNTAKTEDHPQHIDIIKLLLPKPLPPGGQIIITTPFHVKLPYNFSRGGYEGNTFQITQWYPKPAVYDAAGWHPMPYLDQGEFYSEFGNFDVRITLPKNYVVAATGQLQNEDEKVWLKTKQFVATTQKEKTRLKKTTVGKPKKQVQTPAPKIASPIAVETKTIQFLQNNVHDFAWFANKDFIVAQDTCLLPGGITIDVSSYYTSQQSLHWKNSLQFAKDAVRFYSNEIGNYAYKTLSVVQGPQSFGGGMEYPTITVISPTETAEELDITMAHEIGHNWFYGMLATNERDHPWMDEGLNTFYERKYTRQKYGLQEKPEEIFFQTIAGRKKDQSLTTASENFSATNYGLSAYHKTAEWLLAMQNKVGADAFRKMMQTYFEQWQFKHPQPADFLAIAKNVLGNGDSISGLNNTGVLADNLPKGFAFVSPIKKNSIKNYLLNPSKNIFAFSPAIGVNGYDKLMVGGIFTNYKLPPNKFHILLIPMYATGSKQLTGLGKVNYTATSSGFIRKADFFVNAARFSMNDFTDTAGNKYTMQFQKLVPGLKLTLREKDPRSTVSRSIQWKTFLFNEESLRIKNDSLFSSTDTIVTQRVITPATNRYLNQLQLVYEDYRALYPFDVKLQVEQSEDFLRPALTANYFFNYPKNGGLQLRFFAGAFIYLNGKTISKQFANDRYHLNLSGANGYEDYTYTDYFVGRNEFEGLASQQMMVRDGGFKVRTDLLASKVGKTDEWLMALNLNSSVPNKINPLAVLPVKIPLRVFFDLGTYADAWKTGFEGDRFLFDLGLHLPLLHESVNIYIPV